MKQVNEKTLPTHQLSPLMLEAQLEGVGCALARHRLGNKAGIPIKCSCIYTYIYIYICHNFSYVVVNKGIHHSAQTEHLLASLAAWPKLKKKTRRTLDSKQNAQPIPSIYKTIFIVCRLAYYICTHAC